MATFDDFPDEILLLVCEALLAQGRLKCLLAVSKKLYKIALPLLCRNVRLERAARAQRQSCATFVLHEDLAKLVSSVQAEQIWPEAYEDRSSALSDKKKENIDDEAMIDRLVDRVCDIFHGNEEKRKEWTEGIEVQDTRYMVPLSLAHVPNVSDLQLGHGYDIAMWNNLDAIITQMQSDSRVAADEKPLQKVKHVFIDSFIDKYPVAPLPLAIAAKWPAIRSIKISAAGNEDCDEVEAAFTDLEPRSRSLERLELCPNSKLLGGNLHGLLRASRGLREFKYHIGHSWAWIDFHTAELQEALDQHRNTLERLTLWYDLSEMDSDSDSIVKPMNFSAYTQLTDLCIEMMFLFDIDSNGENAQSPRLAELLPASLVKLNVVQVVSGAGKLVAAGLRTLLEHSRNFSNLKTLEVSVLGDDLRTDGTKVLVDDAGLRDLGPLAKGKGIKFRVLDCKEDYGTGMEFGDDDLLDSENYVEPKPRQTSSQT